MNAHAGREAPQLLDEAARALYLAILERGGRIRSTEVHGPEIPALHILLKLGLVVRQPYSDFYAAVSPRSVGARLSVELRASGVRLLAEADETPSRLAELTRAYESAAPQPIGSGAVSYFEEDMANLQQQMTRLEAEAEEVMAAQPGERGEATLAYAAERTAQFLARGGRVRTIYQLMVRSHAPTAGHAARMTGLGARFRILDEPFQRMVIFDRAVAVIPAGADHLSAALVEDPFMVGCLVDLFERDWERAERVQWDAAPPDRLTPVGRLLAQGLTQRAIATRLGLSERTVAAQIARLREQCDAETLFQLGWQMRATAGAADGF